jgi:hypothetical protein
LGAPFNIMTKVNSSPDRNTFQVENYLARKAEEGEEPSEEYLNMFKTVREQVLEREADPAWQKDNLEWDLRSTRWICNKAKSTKTYAQNLYAALCNNDFQKNEVWNRLGDKTWSCSWRYAGGIVADMREEGDYIEWYCSGIQGEPDEDWIDLGHVPEGAVTDQIREDLFRLGWIVLEPKD